MFDDDHSVHKIFRYKVVLFIEYYVCFICSISKSQSMEKGDEKIDPLWIVAKQLKTLNVKSWADA